MGYVFRLHTGAQQNIEDWGGDATTKYTERVIEQMHDAVPRSEITSIPSPFARIDLVKNAFKKVVMMAEKGEHGLDGKTIHHKMVSDSLDVGQIFFESEKLHDKIRIIAWDREKDLQTLLQSPHKEHRQLGRTLDLFLQQDSATYNFNKMREMFILNYVNGEHTLDIIGATSPSTLFFTPGNADALHKIGREIRFGNDHPFDEEYTPLFKRDFEYQKYWYLLRRSTPNFEVLFKEVNAYLDLNFAQLDDNARAALRKALEQGDVTQYADITVGNAGHVVQAIDGVLLKKRIPQVQSIETASGFTIRSQKRVVMRSGQSVLPLVLPVDNYALNTIYTNERWDRNTVVPFSEKTPLAERVLPGDLSRYPWLTISDFLEDTIIKMPFELNGENFFNGNLDRDVDGKGEKISYLLPLTTRFFEFFSVDDLRQPLADGKNMLELKSNAGGVTAILRIPISGGSIEYRRTYFDGVTANPGKNDGAIVEKRFGLGVMPLIKHADSTEKRHYRIALTERGAHDVALTCFAGTVAVYTDHPNKGDNKPVVREAKDQNQKTNSSESYVLKDDFDRIDVAVGDFRGVVVPKFTKVSGTSQFTFAVDFGTTNTHIEYSVDGTPSSFDIGTRDKQLHLLHNDYARVDLDIAAMFEHDFIPATMGHNDAFSFPMRTVFQESKGLNYDNNPQTLADGNIPFLYEKALSNSYNVTKTDLKWEGRASGIVELYLSNLFMLMRNKVLLGGGKLSETKIVWFYPASITGGRYDQLGKVWRKLYEEYFGSSEEAAKNVICMSESVAPYHYYTRRRGAKSNFITIDVGGGTTDVYVVQGNIPQMLLSFRFASDAIFGDGQGWDSDNNGFVKSYLEKFIDVLASNKKDGLVKVLRSIESKKRSHDIVAFLFSLAQNSEVKNNSSLNFLTQLAGDDQMRYVFILFYGAILYYIAKVMKAKGLERPLSLAFSGNGSKTLGVLSDNNATIGLFAKLIFNGVYGSGTELPLDIIFEDEPKKATCKGGVIKPEQQGFDQIDDIKCTILGDDFDKVPKGQLRYSELTPEIKSQICGQVKEYVEFLFKLHDDNNSFFTSRLSADKGLLQTVKKDAQNPTALKESLESCLNKIYENWETSGEAGASRQEMMQGNKIEEPLFFYPLVGVLHELARNIGEKR